MSLLATSCHGYEATITGWTSGITKMWAFAWLKSSDGSLHRGFVHVHQVISNGTESYFGTSMSGANVLVADANTDGVDQLTPDGGDFYFWNAAQQNKWSVTCAILDTTQSAADLTCIYGRAAATAKAATTRTLAANLGATVVDLVRVTVLRDRRVIRSNSADDATNSTTKVAYIAIGKGSVPTSANIQSCIDGMHPADLPGVWEYWDLTSSGSGLTGALQGVTLAPFGGSASTTWDGADNPTVSAPTGGGGGGSMPRIAGRQMTGGFFDMSGGTA